MPETLFVFRCDRNRPCLKDVREPATAFETSLTATVLRFVRFAPEPCGLSTRPMASSTGGTGARTSV
jgi:hypothetical protein